MKLGADDFIVQFGEAEFLKRIEGPVWTFSDEDVSEETINPEEIKNLFRERVLKSDVEFEPFIDLVKGKTKVRKELLRNIIKGARREWKKFVPKEKSRSEDLLWDRDSEDIPNLFARLGKIIEIEEDTFFLDPDTQSLLNVRPARRQMERLIDGKSLQASLAHIVNFKKGYINKDGDFVSEGYDMLPVNLMDAFVTEIPKYAKLRGLSFFSNSPIYLERTLIIEPGYYDEAKVFYCGHRVAPKVTQDKLQHLLKTFPFADDISRVNALGAILQATLLLHEFKGRHPIILSQGDDQNLGKTTFIRCLSQIAFDEDVPSITYTTRDDEFEKQIASTARRANGVLIDNVKTNSTISSPVLERSLTDPILNFRLLGTSSNIRRPNNFQFFMTLNEGSLSRDLSVRTLPIFFSAQQLHKMPEDFDPTKWVKENREELISELVGMVKNWETAGAKPVRVAYPKFPDIAAFINGVLTENGYSGFLSNFNDSLVKLDAVTRSIIETAALEFHDQGKGVTDERTPSQWREQIEEKIGPQVLSESTTEHGRDTTIGRTLAKMVGKSYTTVIHGTAVQMLVRTRPNASKKGGNSFYWFEKVEPTPSGPKDTKDEESTPNGTSAFEGAAAKNSEDQAFAPDSGTSAPQVTYPQPTEKEKNSAADSVFPSQAPSTQRVCAEVPLTQAIHPAPDKRWEGITPERVFTYVFNGKAYPGKWWDGKSMGELVSIDFETTLIENELVPDFILGSAFNGQHLAFLSPHQLDDFFKLHRDSQFVAHNAVFELEVLSQHLNQPQRPFELLDQDLIIDTLLLERLKNLAMSGQPELKGCKLGNLIKKTLGIELPKDVEIKGKVVRTSYGDFKDTPLLIPDGYFHYNAFDTISTLDLYQSQKKEIKSLCEKHRVDSGHLLSHGIQIKAALAASMTSRRGIAIDQDAVLEHQKNLEDQIKCIKTVFKSYGYSGGEGQKQRFKFAIEEIEKASDGKINFHRVTNKKGKRVVSEQAQHLVQFNSHPFVNAFLEEKNLNGYLKKYVEPFLGLTECHPDIDILKTTGRISISNPPLQQIPRPTNELDLRRQFIARPGHLLIISDFAGAELVTLAQTCLDLFGESKLADALNDKKDVHKITAAKFFNKNPGDVTKEERQYGKVANFGLPGGIGIRSLMAYAKAKNNLILNEDEAKNIKAAWLNSYPEMKKYLALADIEYQRTLLKFPPPYEMDKSVQLKVLLGIAAGQTTTTTTNRIYSPDEISWAWSNIERLISKFPILEEFRLAIMAGKGSLKLRDALTSTLVAVVPRSGRIRANCQYTDFSNNAFQALTSDVAKTAWYELQKAGIPVVHTVHDEVVGEVPELAAEKTKTNMDQILIGASRIFCPDVAMSVDSKISKCWGK